MSWFVPVAPRPVIGHPWKKLGSILFAPSPQVFIHIRIHPEPPLLQAEQSQLSQPFLLGKMLQSIILGALHLRVS